MQLIAKWKILLTALLLENNSFFLQMEDICLPFDSRNKNTGLVSSGFEDVAFLFVNFFLMFNKFLMLQNCNYLGLKLPDF